MRMNEMPYRRPDGDSRAEEIAELVREIATNRRALLPFRPVILDLGRIVKDPWKTGPVEVDRVALVDALPKGEKVSVRLDPDLQVGGRPTGVPRRIAPDTVVFRRGREETGRVVGDPSRLGLLLEIVGKRADSVVGVLLPKDLTTFENVAAERASVVSALLAEGREKVERVERLVCALYEVPDDLTDAVVAHALDRAAR